MVILVWGPFRKMHIHLLMVWKSCLLEGGSWKSQSPLVLRQRWILVGWCFITAASVVTSIFLSWEQQRYITICGDASPQFPESSVSASADAKQVACGYKLRGLGHRYSKTLKPGNCLQNAVSLYHIFRRGSSLQDESEPLLWGYQEPWLT